MAANDFVSGTTLSPNTFGFTLFAQIMNIYRFGSLDVPEYFGGHIRDAHPILLDFTNAREQCLPKTTKIQD